METLSPLYFPDTLIDTVTGLSLASFFHSIHILSPVNETEGSTQPEIVDPFMENDFCQVHIPCPFAEEDRKRFLHLVQEIRTQGKDFINQLKMLTLSSLSSSPKKEIESSRAILSALFPSSDQTQQIMDEKEIHELWQARLVLKLAEIIDREEADLSEQIRSIKDLESRMIQQLRGDNGASSSDAYSNQSDTTVPGQASQGSTTSRMKAWTSLYRYWDESEIPIWITTRSGAADIIFERCTKSCGNKPFQFLQVGVPTIPSGDTASFVSEVDQFRTNTNALRTRIANLISQLLVQGSEKDPLAPKSPEIADLERLWMETIDHHFPKNKHGRANITLHLIQGTVFRELFDKKRGTHSPFVNSIVGVMGPSS